MEQLALKLFTSKPFIGNRGAIIGAYCIAEIKGSGYQIEFMTNEELEKIKKRSPSAGYGTSPWTTDEAEMKRKTVVRRASKYLPMSIEVAAALQEADEAEFLSNILEHDEQPKVTFHAAKTSLEAQDLTNAFLAPEETESQEAMI